MSRLCFATLLALALALSGCGGRESGVYGISADEAYRRLLSSELPELVRVRQCGLPIQVRPEGVPGRSVTWRAFSLGRELVHFTATLAPVGDDRTRVEISISPEANGREAYDGSHSYREPAFNQPLRPAVEEQVAALLEGRDFDRSRVGRGSSPGCDVGRFALQSGRRYPVDKRPGAAVRRYRGTEGSRR
jgi:hypothetical protein